MSTETVGSWTKSCAICKRLDDKIALVTGCNTGIGLYTASELARRGATVIMACRNVDKAEKAKIQILAKYGSTNPKSREIDIACRKVIPSLSIVEPHQLLIHEVDLASLKSIKAFANKIKENYTKIDFLINNAGLVRRKYQTTEDGFEVTMGVNYFGPFLLTELLIPLLKNAAPSRIINISSMTHYDGRIVKPDLQYNEKEYKEMNAYSASKLANVIHAMELSERLKDSGITVVSLHPGVVRTEIMRDLTDFPMNVIAPVIRRFFISPWKGSQTTLYTVLTNYLVSGGYYSNCALKEPKSLVKNIEVRRWFWSRTCELLNIQPSI
uniref:Uncharacterized protein n=1 Tax=Trichobilharzia regenti TaxID=157069 RepID=A0AA85JIY4_TRIRE|nr:unnamed protein product [Trichobilharzia regenti]